VQLFKGGAEAINNSRDPTLELVRSIEPEARAARKRYEDEVLGVERDAYAKIAHALFEIEGTNRYPDATFTLRLSYGAVKGYRERSGYNGAIWMVATTGDSSPAELITGKNVSNARWSPDGQSLIYRRDGQLTLFSLRTKESRTLTSLPGGAGGAVWSPDGRRVAFLSSTPDEQTASEASPNARLFRLGNLVVYDEFPLVPARMVQESTISRLAHVRCPFADYLCGENPYPDHVH